MVNVDKLKGVMKEKRINVETLASMIGIDRATLYRKLNSAGETFTIKEANQIVQILGLTREEADRIFFAQVAACDAN